MNWCGLPLGLLTLALFVAGASSRLRAAEAGGQVLIALDAADFDPASGKWPQRGTTGIAGDFVAKGTPTRQPLAGAPAVVFDGHGDWFVGPITTAALHGPGAPHTVEAWVYQGNAHDQESIVSWGKRWGPDRTFAGFRFGADPDFGAIARWGAGESGFEIMPAMGRWHQLVFTYDGAMQSVYVDGRLDNARTIGRLDAHDMLPIHLGAELGGDLQLEGEFTHFSGGLGRLRILAGALTAGEVRRRHQAGRADFPGPSARPLEQSPMHRFSFDRPAGPAADGATVPDSIGGLGAVVRGNGAVFTGDAVRLPGGPSDTQAYLDFPNGLISAREEVTIEFWGTQDGNEPWCRILSVGTNSRGEIHGPGGDFTGTESLTLFGNVGATQVNRFARSGGLRQNGGPDRNPADYPDTDYGVEFHQVITYDKALAEWHWYRDGILMEVLPDAAGPATLPDVNVWLGRSEFSADRNFRGSFREFRIYHRALSEGEIIGNFLSGPRLLNLAGPVRAMSWRPAEPGSYSWVNDPGSDRWKSGPGSPHPDGAGSIATLASPLSGDQEIELGVPVTLGFLNIGTRTRGGAFTLRATGPGAITMDSGTRLPASISQLPGTPGNFIDVPLVLHSDTEVTNSSDLPLLLRGPISGTGGFTKTGAGPLILTGDGSGHRGPVRVTGGALILGDGGPAGSLAGSPVVVSAPGRLIFNRSDGQRVRGEHTGSGDIVHAGGGPLTVGAEGSLKHTGMLEIASRKGGLVTTGIIDGPRALRADGPVVFGAGSLTRLGAWLSIGVRHGGRLTVREGATVEIGGAGHFNIGDVGTGDSALFLEGGSITAKEIFIGKNPTTSGVVIQTGGHVKKASQLDTRLGGVDAAGSGVWGAWRMTGGTFEDDWNLQVGAHGTGVMEIAGGGVRVGGYLSIGRFAAGAGRASHGLLDVSGGTVAVTSPETLLLVGEEGFGVLNVRGGGRVTCGNRMVIGAGAIEHPGEGVVNLLPGGELETAGIGQFNGSGAIGVLNFDGGTLRATAAAEDFITGLDAIRIRERGAVIDTNGFDIAIHPPLEAPAGRGVVEIPVMDGGHGYLGAPFVHLAGGAGNGATAVAELKAGRVRRLLVTSPGDSFLTPPAVEILGGGAGRGLVTGTPVLAANSSGGLTKTGRGCLTLLGDNTYRGVTLVTAGSLCVDGRLAGPVTIGRGASLGGSGRIDGPVTVESGADLDPGGADLAIHGDLAVRGALVCRPGSAGVGVVEVGGTLDLAEARLAVVGSAAPAGGTVVLARYGTLGAEFPPDMPLPPGYRVDYRHAGLNQIALVATAAETHGN